MRFLEVHLICQFLVVHCTVLLLRNKVILHLRHIIPRIILLFPWSPRCFKPSVSYVFLNYKKFESNESDQFLYNLRFFLPILDLTLDLTRPNKKNLKNSVRLISVPCKKQRASMLQKNQWMFMNFLESLIKTSFINKKITTVLATVLRRTI